MNDLNQTNVRSDIHTNTVARLRKIADDLEKNSFMLSAYKILLDIQKFVEHLKSKYALTMAMQ